MKNIRLSGWRLLSVCLFGFCCAGLVASEEKLPAGGRDLLGPGALDAATVIGRMGDQASVRPVSAEHPGFDRAWRVQTREKTAAPWDIQLSIPVSGEIKEGDALWLEWWVRKIASDDETGEVRGSLVIEQGGEPFAKAVTDYPFSAGSAEWRRITIPWRSFKTLKTGEAFVKIRLGQIVQTLEIGGLRVLDYGRDLKLSELPSATRISYPGREPDAPWRAAAQTRIELHRKSDLAIEVRDAAGRPVPGAEVSIRQTRQAFNFSSAVAARELLDANADGSPTRIPGVERYREMVPKLFNMVTMESDLKWLNWGYYNPANPARTLRALEWLRENKVPVRGHVLLWPSWRFTPPDLRTLADRPHALRKRVGDHIADILGATGDLVGDWDVVNEPQNNNDLIKILGEDWLAGVFKQARELHPRGRLFLNEAVNFNHKTNHAAGLDHFERAALDLRRRGAPIDGLGFQCHYGWDLTPPEDIVAVLDRFAAHGFALQVTEFDVDVTDERLQADYLRDFYTAVFSHPAVDTLQMWGFWAGRHWRPECALWRADWSIKPSGQAYLDLLASWTTRADLRADARGRVSLRGFRGDYEIVVRHAGKTARHALTLGDAPLTLPFPLP